MHILALEPGARFFFLPRMSDGDAGDGKDRCGQRKEFPEFADAVFARMDAQPAGAQTQRVRTQQQIFNGRRAVLQQITELPVMGRIEIAANNDPQRGRGRGISPVDSQTP